MTGRTACAALVLVCFSTGVPVEPTRAQDPPEFGFRLAYNERGELIPERGATPGQIVAAASGKTDVLVLSHGWWNDPLSAECLYRRMIERLVSRRPPSLNPDSFRPLVVGIYWPSAIFPIEHGDCPSPGVPESAAPPDLEALIRAWVPAAFPIARDRSSRARVERLARLLAREQRGKRLSERQGREVVSILLAWRAAGEEPPVHDGPEEDVFNDDTASVARRWKEAPLPSDLPVESASPRSWLGFANAFTFWTMKARAGIVGSRGVFDFLQAAQELRRRGARLHLVGHSFGGKLLAAAVNGHGRAPANEVDSFTILQGAFSHFAFATADEITRMGIPTRLGGLYSDIVGGRRVHGPLVATYSRHDVPNRMLYPAGVALTGDYREAALVGRFGSLGANGIQGPSVFPLQLSLQPIPPLLGPGRPGLVSVEASEVIRGHSDIVQDGVFDLVWSAILSSRAAGR